MSKMSNYIGENFPISKKTVELVEGCEAKVQAVFESIKQTAEINQLKVIEAFRANEVSVRHFSGSTGYGYGDIGRDMLCKVYADAFGAKSAIVSPLLMSGTHAISTALFGILRPKEKMLCITGMPYDTLLGTISGTKSSLSAYDIGFISVPLVETQVDLPTVLAHLKQDSSIKLVYIQRSTGYDVRSAFTCDYIKTLINAIRNHYKNIIIMVDNCYGEFVNLEEPTNVGADIIAGSLIKNAGGGLAPTGGYIAGQEDLVDLIAQRFTAPNIAMEIGSYTYGYDRYFQGLFLAPHTVAQALMGVVLASNVFACLGFAVTPTYVEERGDITQTIIFDDETLLINFIRGIQKASPIDAHVVPYPWDMPGYKDPVIMAAGTFVQGASIELSADAPIKPPYAAYLQGGLTYEHAKLGIMYAIEEMQL